MRVSNENMRVVSNENMRGSIEEKKFKDFANKSQIISKNLGNIKVHSLLGSQLKIEQILEKMKDFFQNMEKNPSISVMAYLSSLFSLFQEFSSQNIELSQVFLLINKLFSLPIQRIIEQYTEMRVACKENSVINQEKQMLFNEKARLLEEKRAFLIKEEETKREIQKLREIVSNRDHNMDPSDRDKKAPLNDRRHIETTKKLSNQDEEHRRLEEHHRRVLLDKEEQHRSYLQSLEEKHRRDLQTQEEEHRRELLRIRDLLTREKNSDQNDMSREVEKLQAVVKKQRQELITQRTKEGRIMKLLNAIRAKGIDLEGIYKETVSSDSSSEEDPPRETGQPAHLFSFRKEPRFKT